MLFVGQILSNGPDSSENTNTSPQMFIHGTLLLCHYLRAGGDIKKQGLYIPFTAQLIVFLGEESQN